ncbi:WXG100 family type VII secretion target [Mycobacteroides salmoniphilum]|uniref:WXG100 family type VII secretion target n=1 Tax=Mycobacteroides salmoniphilum TaxID=404941 RepID=UPI00099467BE|nr:WXG100 family type VII secretion target [Mycobacteroides salmoniphilum]
MADQRLRVSTTALEQGARELRQHHRTIETAITEIHRRAQALQGVWTGPAANDAATAWDDLHKELTSHVDMLSEHAELLLKTSKLHADQEQLTTQTIASTGS